jgi:type VI secretion system protein ImpG
MRIIVRDPSNPKVPAVVLPARALYPVGFAEDEGMLPYGQRSFLGYRLLQEFFTLPAKFLFVDVTGMSDIWGGGFRNAAELVFLFSGTFEEEQRQRLEIGVSPATFRLGAVPIVNLFSQTAEPILLDQYKQEYQIVPDIRRPNAMEVFSVDGVSTIDSTTRQTITYRPFHHLRHEYQAAGNEYFWISNRRPSTWLNDDAAEIYLSLVDRAMHPKLPDKDTLTVRVTCTNRNLPSHLPFGNKEGDFELEGNSPVKRIVSLAEPTRPARPPMARMALWHLISHLSLNYLSLVEGGCGALQQILRLYNFADAPSAEKMIEGITSVKSRQHFARIASDNGIFFARGTRVELELDEDQFVGGGVYLFAGVIEQFLAHYVSLNSFTQLVATSKRRRGGVLRTWPPRAGQKILV